MKIGQRLKRDNGLLLAAGLSPPGSQLSKATFEMFSNFSATFKRYFWKLTSGNNQLYVRVGVLIRKCHQ